MSTNVQFSATIWLTNPLHPSDSASAPGQSALEEQKCLESKSREEANEPRSHLKGSKSRDQGSTKRDKDKWQVCIREEGRKEGRSLRCCRRPVEYSGFKARRCPRQVQGCRRPQEGQVCGRSAGVAMATGGSSVGGGEGGGGG